MTHSPMNTTQQRPARDEAYNFAYLDEQTKRMIRRALLKAVAIPGYQGAVRRARNAAAVWLGHRRYATDRRNPGRR